MRVLLGLASALVLSACGVPAGQLPATPGETASKYGYVPLDPLPVNQEPSADSCKEAKTPWLPLLQALPDLTVRFAVAEVDASGGLTFGPAKITSEGSAYRAILDYVNADAVPVSMFVRKIVLDQGGARKEVSIASPGTAVGFQAILADDAAADLRATISARSQENYDYITVPVYVGVGLRLSADIRALKGGVALSGLGTIGVQAEANALSGTLTVQSLGVNGKSIAMALPLPNKLDQTTIETAILAVGSSRAILYATNGEADAGNQARPSPRVVGLYSPIGTDPLLINAIYAELSKTRPVWRRPCAEDGTA